MHQSDILEDETAVVMEALAKDIARGKAANSNSADTANLADGMEAGTAPQASSASATHPAPAQVRLPVPSDPMEDDDEASDEEEPLSQRRRMLVAHEEDEDEEHDAMETDGPPSRNYHRARQAHPFAGRTELTQCAGCPIRTRCQHPRKVAHSTVSPPCLAVPLCIHAQPQQNPTRPAQSRRVTVRKGTHGASRSAAQQANRRARAF